MSYATIEAGLYERMALVPGLKVLLHYEPNTIQDAPAMYLILDSFTRHNEGQICVMKYRTLHRLWIKWQDNEAAEAQLRSFVNIIPALLDLDPQLGGALDRGVATMPDGQAEWREIGGVVYRTVDFFTETTEKGIYQDGLI